MAPAQTISYNVVCSSYLSYYDIVLLGSLSQRGDQHSRRSSSLGSNKPPLQDIENVASYIKQQANSILVMVGAGMSTPSGIPDFRSPGTGLYDNLQKYDLPYHEAIFDIHYFMMDPRPFFTLGEQQMGEAVLPNRVNLSEAKNTLSQDLCPGVNYKPNTAHHFLRLLHEEGKLQMVYTQNIDGLERLAGIPEEKLVEAHGSFATASCTLCGRRHDADQVKRAIVEGAVPVLCEAAKCKGKVKPDIVFFGENLPSVFWDYHLQVPFTDLLLVMGTSLEVYPFAKIADEVTRQTPRVLINLSAVGSFGSRDNDTVLGGDLVHTVEELTKALGWEEKLRALENNYFLQNVIGAKSVRLWCLIWAVLCGIANLLNRIDRFDAQLQCAGLRNMLREPQDMRECGEAEEFVDKIVFSIEIKLTKASDALGMNSIFLVL
ncbi:NAD-dependent protein deacetylase sirtuin-3-like [Portunus trituberculatus]|uniref:NAD-dependent protein deacetylase sirtuin-3-like n=1 Tax=Portunus trituberculatus TaxID=210409 RepID=UPI001E1D0F78|nr:NAD-dependent protein deacetylase sirtuin-3-like [Portunus trituberculatus]